MALATPVPFRERFAEWARERADDTVLQWLFGAMLTATVAVLVLDYREMQVRAAERHVSLPDRPTNPAEPLPPARRQDGPDAPVRRSDSKLQQKMSFDLAADGRLLAVGTIEPGTAQAFAAEIEKRGSYVKTVVLHSPGGSVSDALEMGRLIREKKLATEVEAGQYCASSCPLVFAGGAERRAGEKAAIGVHQVFSVSRTQMTGESGMDNAQRVSAQCQKYLREMGIDLEVWVHAMETPKERLYYFKSDELLSLKLATQVGQKKAPETGRARS